MEEHDDIELEIEKCNEECKSCQVNFQKEGITFSPTLCRYCPTGAKLHRMLVRVSDSEAKWGSLDWNSSKYEKYYNG